MAIVCMVDEEVPKMKNINHAAPQNPTTEHHSSENRRKRNASVLRQPNVLFIIYKNKLIVFCAFFKDKQITTGLSTSQAVGNSSHSLMVTLLDAAKVSLEGAAPRVHWTPEDQVRRNGLTAQKQASRNVLSRV